MSRGFHHFLFSCVFLLASQLTAQRELAQEKLAEHHLERREFDKAAEYLERLYDRQPERWYQPYYQALVETKDYHSAEKLVKKQLRRQKNAPQLFVHLGNVYHEMEDTKKEKDAYERALKELIPVQPFLQQLAQAFREQHLYDYALEVYIKGEKRNPDYGYNYEKAEIYREKGDIRAMTGEYLDALERRPSELAVVQINLQNSLGYDDEHGGMRNPILREELQKRIARNPSATVLVEFLIFIQKQQHDFEGAFVQARALDKRLNEEGTRIYELARLCVDNHRWETARRCYQYLLEKGKNNSYYDIATIDGTIVEYLAITEKPQPAREELESLEQKLKVAYEKYRSVALSFSLLRNLATLQAYYLGKAHEAVTSLEKFIAQPAIDEPVRADFKLLLGDIYLVSGSIWDASLMYSQVEKDFKYEPIGQEAKFRNAKLSYYAGDFSWAKAQCDVLKGATSKLIANDALDLSLVISDAIGVDTNAAPLQMFSSAELLVLQHRYEDAIAKMDSVNLLFSNHTLGDDISFKKAGIFQSLGKYAEAESMYHHILEYYPTELYGDDAQFRLAALYDQHLKESVKAREAFQDVLVKYPGSIYTVEARKRFRELRGDVLNN